MTRGPLKFKETDLVRAIKSAVKAGLQVTGFKIKTTGDIEIRTSEVADDESNPILICVRMLIRRIGCAGVSGHRGDLRSSSRANSVHRSLQQTIVRLLRAEPLWAFRLTL